MRGEQRCQLLAGELHEFRDGRQRRSHHEVTRVQRGADLLVGEIRIAVDDHAGCSFPSNFAYSGPVNGAPPTTPLRSALSICRREARGRGAYRTSAPAQRLTTALRRTAD